MNFVNLLAMICAGLTTAVAGVVFGYVFFRTLAMNANMYLQGGRVGVALTLHGLRIAGAVALFWTAAQYGAGPLLAALLGFLVARAMFTSEKKDPQEVEETL